MTTRPSLLAIAALLAAFVSTPRPLFAQGGGISAVVVRADHALLSDPLVGAAAHLRFPLAGDRTSARLGVEYASGDARRIGSPCTGLVRPGTCGPEPVRDEGSLTTVSGGLAQRVLQRRHLLVDATADVGVGQVHADTRGMTSGGSLSASKALLGGELGIEAAWTPSRRLPLALEAGVSVGGMTPLSKEQIVDGYTPFENAFGTRRLRVGVSWRPQAR